jgi:hypothetical protein
MGVSGLDTSEYFSFVMGLAAFLETSLSWHPQVSDSLEWCVYLYINI